MRPSDLALYRFPPAWRWVIERIWRVEHAFERAKAEGRAEDDTRLRIFFVLAMFATGFLVLAIGAGKSVLFPDIHVATTPAARQASATPSRTATASYWRSICPTTASITTPRRTGTRRWCVASSGRPCRNCRPSASITRSRPSGAST